MKQNKTNKWVVGAASAALVASAIVPVASAASFSDIEGNDHKEAILALADANIVGGYPDGTFKPNAVVTRGNVTKFLGKWLVSEGYEIPTDYATEARFTDLPTTIQDKELLQYAALVKDAGVFKGSNNQLMYTKNMSREQMAVVLVRAINTVYGVDLVAEYKEANFESSITDLANATADENREAIIALEYAELTNVKAFNPKNTLTRGQFASFLNRTVNTIANEEVELDVKSVEAVNGKLTVKLAEAAEEVSVEDFTVSQTINGGTATEVTPSAAVLSEDGLTVTLTVDEVAAKETTEQSVVYTVNEVAAPAFVVEASTLAVTSVSAINATQVEVKFSKAVDKATLFTNGVSGALKALNSSTVVSLTSLDSVSAGTLSGELSEDGKTLIITSQNVLAKRYDVVVDGLKSTDAKNIKKYEEMITIAADEKAPTITGTEQISANLVKINFSEPVKAHTTATLKYADGTTVNGASVSVDAGATSVTVDLSATTVEVNKPITITFIGLQDQAGNLITPNPATVQVTKLQVDGVKPTVSTVTQTGAKTFNVKFSKDLAAAPSVTVSGYTVDAVTKVSASEYKVTVTANLTGVQNVNVAAGYKDLAGQTGDAITKVVTFVEDTTAPKATSAKTVTVDGVEYLELTFDKDVTEGDVTVSGSYTKDYVTTAVASTSVAATYASTSNKKVVRTPLSGIATVKDAVYTLDVISTTTTGVTSLSGVAFAKTSATFTRGEDVAANTTKLAAPVVTQTTNDTVTVTFTGKVDGSTATDISNYTVDGAVVEKASLEAYEATTAGKQVVTLTLKQDSNAFTGTRNITVQNVKALGSSVTMDKYTVNTLSLNENVRATVTKAELTGNQEITLTFSENVYDITNVAAKDFDLYIGGTKATATLTTENVTLANAKNTLKLVITGTLTADDLTKGLSVKAATDIDVKDIVGNGLNITTVSVTQ